MGFAAAFVAACDWLGLLVGFILVCANLWVLEFAWLFPGRQIGRLSALWNEFYPADPINIFHGKFLP